MPDLRALLESYAPQAELYFFRSHDGMEIDGVIAAGRRLLPFEIKATATLRPEHSRNLHGFLQMQTAARIGLLFYMGREVIPNSEQIAVLLLAALQTRG